METKDQVSDETLSDSNLEELKQQWTLEQLKMSTRVSEVDGLLNDDPNLFGGLDISFIEGDSVNACACYVVIDRDFKVVYQDVSMVKLTVPYISSFLGFREADIFGGLVLSMLKSLIIELNFARFLGRKRKSQMSLLESSWLMAMVCCTQGILLARCCSQGALLLSGNI